MRTPMPRLVKDSKTAIWFFRWSLPIALQQSLNRKSLYISLKTRNLRLAQCLAGVLNLRVETMKKLPDLNEASLRKMLEIDLDRGIFRADTPEELAHGLNIVESIGRLRNSTPTQKSNSPALPKKPYMQASSPLFRKVADEVIKEISRTLKASSIYKYKKTYDAYIEANGNRFLEDVDRSEIRRFKDKMLEAGLTPHTVNGHLGRLYFLFEYAIKNKYVQGDNPASNHLIPHSKRALKSRDKFYDEDLKKIFNWESYKKMAITPDYFWGPLICLFSGMRIEECTSLEVSSIKTDDGVILMHIKDAKTSSGVRHIPIHKKLIEMGLLDYVEEVKKLGKTSLFWYLSEGTTGQLVNHNGTKKNLSRRFSLYLKSIKVKQDQNCFHSLRHTAITRWASRNVNNSIIYRLSGHKNEDNTHFTYLHSVETQSLKTEVDKLDFDKDLDLDKFEWRSSLHKLMERENKRETTSKKTPLRPVRKTKF